MRIKFDQIPFSNIQDRFETIRNFDIINMTIPSTFMSFDNYVINNFTSYTDRCRYQLNVYDIVLSRCYANQTTALDNHLTNKMIIRVFEINIENFEVDFDFQLFRNDYVDYWRNDYNIHVIKPSIITYEIPKMGILAFQSLASSYFAKILNVLDTHYIYCKKKGSQIILSFGLDEISNANSNIVLDYFVDAIYEIVKCTQGRFNYDIPDDINRKKIDLVSWYKNRANKKSDKKQAVFEKY